MEFEFYIDADTGEPHIARHGVEHWEAIDVLENAEVSYNGRGGTLVAMGQTRNGRYLRVIYRGLGNERRRKLSQHSIFPQTQNERCVASDGDDHEKGCEKKETCQDG